VRLVLRVLDWYTSCSSLNLPSAEYAGNARNGAAPRELVQLSFSHSLIDAGQRSEKSSHAALPSGITSPTGRSESSFGCVRSNSWRLTGAGAVATKPPDASQSRRGAAVGPTCCESRVQV